MTNSLHTHRLTTLTQNKSKLADTLASYSFKSAIFESDTTNQNYKTKDLRGFSFNVKESQSKEISPTQYRLKNKTNITKTNRSQEREKLRLELSLEKKSQNPEIIHIVEESLYSTLNTQGLCKFEYEKTIAGKLKHRQQRHLDFCNQTPREKMSFSDQVEVECSPKCKKVDTRLSLQKKVKNSFADKCHDFESYSSRKVFEPREEIDRFYETDNYFRITRPRTIRETVKISGITGRSEEKTKETSALTYEEQASRNFVMKGSPKHKIPLSPRKIEFSRQVISDARGCYR